MRVTVKLIGPLIYKAGFSEKKVALPAAATVGDLLSRIKVPRRRPKIVTRNGKVAGPDEALKDGDRVAVSPIYSGG